MKNLRFVVSLIMTFFLLSLILVSTTAQGELNAEYTVTETPQAVKKLDDGIWESYVDELIRFDASDSTDAKNYTWEFGDDSENNTVTLTSNYASHAYTATGTYMVKLTAKNSDGKKSTAFGNITIVERPEAYLIIRDKATETDLAPDFKVKVGQEIIFDASGSKGHIITYYFGYNLENEFVPTTSIDKSTISYSWDEPGDYKVGLRVIDNLGVRDQYEQEEFIIVHVEKEDAESSDLFGSLPVPLPFLLGGAGLIIFIIIVVVLYRNGYIFLGGGGSSKSDDKEEKIDGTDMDRFRQKPSGPAKTLDVGKLMSDEKQETKSDLGLPPLDKPEEEKTVYEIKTCPKCKGKIPVTSLDRPLKLTCPDCSASFTLKAKAGKPSAPAFKAPVQKKAESKKETVYETKTCPKCKGKIPITSLDRPLKVACPGCSASFTLKAKSKGSTGKSGGAKTGSPPKNMPAEETEIVICPSCGKALPIPAGAKNARCPQCSTEFDV